MENQQIESMMGQRSEGAISSLGMESFHGKSDGHSNGDLGAWWGHHAASALGGFLLQGAQKVG